jgi:sec-independent protein translocase protein TatA
MFRQIGPTEILLILGVVLLLFGGRKLPELARGSGRALRIFKSEVKELNDGDQRDATDKAAAADPTVRPDQIADDLTVRSDQAQPDTARSTDTDRG